MFKVGEFEAPVVLKLMLQPKWLKHCFGEGYDPDYNVNTASREYYFEDSNLSQYMLYDFRHTTMYQPNIPGYDYEVTFLVILEPAEYRTKEAQGVSVPSNRVLGNGKRV
jgi:hypothetical protein